MEVQKIHPAEEYLRNVKNPTSLYVRISGERRKLFINRSDGEGVIGIIAKGKRKRGYVFNAWSSIEKVYYPTTENEEEAEKNRHPYKQLVTQNCRCRFDKVSLREPYYHRNNH